MQIQNHLSTKPRVRTAIHLAVLLLAAATAIASVGPAAAWYDGMPFGPNFEGKAIDADSHDKAHGDNEKAADTASDNNDGETTKGNDDPLFN